MAGRTSMSVPAEGQTAHSARMDDIYRVQRHFYDITRKYYLFGRDRTIIELAPPRDGTVLEIGCGTARNLVGVARRFARVTVCGIDISREMLASARKAIAKGHLGARVFVGQADAANFDPMALFGRMRFDRILFSYTLSMITDWQGALRQAAKMLEPGGALSIVDFGNQHGLPSWFRAGLRHWLKQFEVSPRDDLPGWLSSVADELALDIPVNHMWGGYAVRITAMRHQIIMSQVISPSR